MKKFLLFLTLTCAAVAQVNNSYNDLVDKPTVLGGATLVATDRTPNAVADRVISVAKSTAAYNDTIPFVEAWSNLSNWTYNSGKLQVSGGRLYALSAGLGENGANHAFVVGAEEEMRAVFEVGIPSGAVSSGALFIGVSSDAAGAIPSGAAAKARGVRINGANGYLTTWDGSGNGGPGEASFPVPVIPGVGTFIVTAVADKNYLSFVITKSDGTMVEQRVRWARAGFNINNLFVFNSDTRELTGLSVGKIGARKAIATITPPTGIETVGQTVQWTGDGTNNFKIRLPVNYDSRTPAPLAIVFHGNGSDENHFIDHANSKLITDAFHAAGYIVLSASYGASGSTWGSQASLDAYVAAYRYTATHYAIGPVVLHGQSMGGIESLLILAEGRIPGIVAWTGCVPNTSLANSYAGNYTAAITTAYGISGDYAAKTAGHDPQAKAGYEFRGVPMWALVATDDTSVPYAQNMALFRPIVEPYAANITVVETTGGHGVAYGPFTAAMMAYIKPYVDYALAHGTTERVLLNSDVQTKRATSTLAATSTTLAVVPGLSATVLAGHAYSFRAILYVDADATGGHKYALSGSAVAKSIVCDINARKDADGTTVISARKTAFDNSSGQAGATTVKTTIEGVIEVSTSGTLLVQFAQNTASGTSSVVAGSLVLTRL